MKLVQNEYGFNVWLSARDTRDWANRPNERWPCSQLSGHRLFASFDSCGLNDMSVDGRSKDIDVNEFNACISDHVRSKLSVENPAWFVAVGQFETRK